MKIEINGIYPVNSEANNLQNILLRNKFEEIALFLDCDTIQATIAHFRKRINLTTTIPYESFDQWKEHGITQDEFSKKETIYLYNLNYDIDYLSNVGFVLSKQQHEELKTKKEERIKWNDPYYAFSKALEEKLTSLQKTKFIQIALKAIVCGEVCGEDFPDHLVENKGARKAIFLQRKCYWLYEELPPEEKKKKLGYGTIGKLPDINETLQTVRSQVTTYSEKLAIYDSTFTL